MEDELFDICPLREDWRQGFHYDALKESWSHKVNFGNPPFSQAALFIEKALAEFLKGKNVILLLPKYLLVQKAIFKEILKDICDLHSIGEVAFIKDGKQLIKPYPRECVLIYFLQPSFIQRKADFEGKWPIKPKN